MMPYMFHLGFLFISRFLLFLSYKNHSQPCNVELSHGTPMNEYNGSEEPVPPEPPQPTIKQQVLEPDAIPTTTPLQDTNCHMMSPLESSSCGEILESNQLEVKTKNTIMDFSTELFTSHYHKPPENPQSSSIACLTLIIPTQESCGEKNVTELCSFHEAATVSSEEQFVLYWL